MVYTPKLGSEVERGANGQKLEEEEVDDNSV